MTLPPPWQGWRMWFVWVGGSALGWILGAICAHWFKKIHMEKTGSYVRIFFGRHYLTWIRKHDRTEAR